MQSRPNIILILIDDMGWKDLGTYGSEFYETPNINRLASEGMLFTNAYAACPVCSPTRASIMSGQYPARLGLTNYIGGDEHPALGKLIDVPYIRQLPHSVVSLASSLHNAEYQTWHVGKWHLGDKSHYPDQHGFDENIGGCHYGHPAYGYFSPYHIPTLSEGPNGEYLTDRLTDEAIQLIKNREENRPFYLNLWYYSVHNPIQAPEQWIQYFKEKAKRLGVDTLNPFEIGEIFPTTNKCHKRILRRTIQSNPVYAAMIYALDLNIGRLMEALKQQSIDEKTLVIFTSDNGGLATSEGSPTSNLPLSEGKGWMYEGGTREPLIARWPKMINPGTICETTVTSPDFYPTFVDLADVPLPDNQVFDGISFVPSLKGCLQQDREAIFWHYPHYGNQGGTPGAAILSKNWKLIRFFETPHEELYNLTDDISESKNLINDAPEIAIRLRELLNQWLDSIEAKIPEPNSFYSGYADERHHHECHLLDKYDLETPLGILLYNAESRKILENTSLDINCHKDRNFLVAYTDENLKHIAELYDLPLEELSHQLREFERTSAANSTTN